MEDQMTTTSKPRPGSISGRVVDCGKPDVAKPESGKTSKGRIRPPVENAQPIIDAEVALYCVNPTTPGALPEMTVRSNEDGGFEFTGLRPGHYWVRCRAFAWEDTIET